MRLNQPNNSLVPTHKGEAPLLAGQVGRLGPKEHCPCLLVLLLNMLLVLSRSCGSGTALIRVSAFVEVAPGRSGSHRTRDRPYRLAQ